METGIENEIVHDVASLLLEAEVLFAVVMAWIMAIFFSAMATRPSFTKWKDVLKERFWLFVVYFTLSVITVAAAYWSSFNYLSLGVVAVFLIVLLISFPLYFLFFAKSVLILSFIMPKTYQDVLILFNFAFHCEKYDTNVPYQILRNYYKTTAVHAEFHYTTI